MDQHSVRQLGRVDWDFISSTLGANPGLHWYPGNFVPELPGALIDILSRPGDCVFDPFGGVGTTGLSAIIRGRTAVCCDLNPIAVLASYVTSSLLVLKRVDPAAFDLVISKTRNLISLEDTGDSLDLGGLDTLDQTISHHVSPSPSEMLLVLQKGKPCADGLVPWYSPETLRRLLDLTRFADDPGRPAFLRLVSWAMISSIARSLSSQTRSWGHIADRVIPKELIDKDPASLAGRWLTRISRTLRSVANETNIAISSKALSVQLVDWSAKNELALPKCNLLITSPPYAGAIDYALAQRLSLSLLGYGSRDIAALTGAEMGARRKRFSPGHVEAWAEGLATAVRKQLSFMVPTATAVFVMPHKDAGREIGEQVLKEVLAEEGWTLGFEQDRSIRQVKARQSWTSIKRETICVFSRSGE